MAAKHKGHQHYYVSTFQGYVCARCGKAKTGKTLKGEMQLVFDY